MGLALSRRFDLNVLSACRSIDPTLSTHWLVSQVENERFSIASRQKMTFSLGSK